MPELVGGDPVRRVQLARRDHYRRLAHEAVLAVDELAELGKGLQTVAGARLGVGLLDDLQALFAVTWPAWAAAFFPAVAFPAFCFLRAAFAFTAASSSATAWRSIVISSSSVSRE